MFLSEMILMKSVKVLTFLLRLALVAVSCIIPSVGAVQEKAGIKETPANAQILVRGHVFCLNESGHRLDAGSDCSKEAHLYEMQANDKKIYKFAPKDVLTSMFKESRVRRLELQISGILHDKNTLEIASLHAIHDGKLYDIFYYCDICSITAFGPGDCPCCYNPLEFREKPALDNQ